MRSPKGKLFLIMGIVLSIFFFSNDYSLIDIEKIAIVVAIGIDEIDDGYEVTAQIAVPQTNETISASNDAMLTARGKTVFEAIENVGEISGWHEKLSFCDTIILGRAVAEKSATSIIDYLLLSERFENSTLVVVSDTTAKDILLATTPLDAISSFALKKIVLKNEWMTDPVNVTNVKKFAVTHYSKSNSAFLPVVKIVKGDSKGKEGASSAVTASTGGVEGEDGGSGGSGGSGNSGGKKKEDEPVVFDANSLALFSDGKYVCTIDKSHSRIFNLLQGPVRESFLETECDGEKYFLKVDANKKSVKVAFDGAPTVKYYLKLKVGLVDSTEEFSLDKKDDSNTVPEKILKKTEQDVRSEIEALHRTVCENDCDILGFKDYVYKFKNDKFDDFNRIPLSALGCDIDVEIVSID